MTWDAFFYAGTGQPRCRQELLPLYTADVLCATAFGKDLGMLETRKTELVQDVKKLSARHGNRCAFLRMRGCPIQCFVTMEVSWGYPQSMEDRLDNYRRFWKLRFGNYDLGTTVGKLTISASVTTFPRFGNYDLGTINPRFGNQISAIW